MNLDGIGVLLDELTDLIDARADAIRVKRWVYHEELRLRIGSHFDSTNLLLIPTARRMDLSDGFLIVPVELFFETLSEPDIWGLFGRDDGSVDCIIFGLEAFYSKIFETDGDADEE